MTQKPSSKKLNDALKIRDVALFKIQEEGHFVNLKEGGQMLEWESDEFLMNYTMPFQKTPDNPKAFFLKQLPYGLDIWIPKKKVLNIEWDDNGQVILISFHRGEWEKTVLSWSP